MNKYLIYILLASFLFACNDESTKKDEPIQQEVKKTVEPNTNISSIKINSEVQSIDSNKKTIIINGISLVPSETLFDFFPKKYKNMTLDEQSSGTSNSGLGKFTTATSVFQDNRNFIRIRLSDYLSGKDFPDLKYLVNIPKFDATFTFQKADLGNDIVGYVQWHKVEAYGIINLFLYNRFNIYMEINGFPELKTGYKDFIKTFNLKKLKEISTSK